MPWAKFESYSFVCIIDSDAWNKLMMIKYRIIQFNSGLQDANLLKYLITYNPVNSRDVNHLQNLFLWDILIESFIFYYVLDVSRLVTCFAVILSKCTVHCTYFLALRGRARPSKSQKQIFSTYRVAATLYVLTAMYLMIARAQVSLTVGRKQGTFKLFVARQVDSGLSTIFQVSDVIYYL